MKKIAFLGAGSWASAVANIVAPDHEIVMYARREDQVQEINTNHSNKKYLQDVSLHPNIKASNSFKEVIEGADLLVNGIPTQSTRSVLKEAKDYVEDGLAVMNISKGIEQNTGKRISQIVEEVLGARPFAVLSGPSHAEEVIIGQPTTVVIASEDIDLAIKLQKAFMNPSFRVYTGTDVLGVELGGAVKNILAIVIGIADALGAGDNPKAALITRGVHETVRFGTSLGGDRRTLYGLAGLGDLIVTATSKHSRNRRAGKLLGQGYSLKEVQDKVGQIIEGVATCNAVFEIAQNMNISMPITEALYDILFKNFSVKESLESLMLRQGKQEFEE